MTRMLRSLLVFISFASLASCSLVTSHHRTVSYEELRPNLDLFIQDGVEAFTQVLPDIHRYQLIVGARDYLFRLSLDGMKKLEEAYWPSSENTILTCQQKGQKREECRNFIKVLLSHNNKLFSCGTNAFLPECNWRDVNSINSIKEKVSGEAKCPYSPNQNITSLITVQGDFYVGSPLDFSSQDYAIYRIMGEPPILRTAQYNPMWLNDPQFVASYEIGNFVYFFFRETAVEYINSGKVIYPRVARVCKNDQGGQFLLRDKWTTFVKARLNCSIDSPYPFYYNEIQGVYYDEREKLVFITFTTPPNSIYGSAVCYYSMDSIEKTFDGPFKYQATQKSTWEREPASANSHSQCHGENKNELDSDRYQLMDDAVQPLSLNPLYTSDLERLEHIAIDTVHTKHHDIVSVIYTSTMEGVIKKLVLVPNSHETCLVEVLHPFPQNSSSSKIFTMKILHDTNSLYLGTKHSVMKVPLHRCEQYKTRSECLMSHDPYCGWNLQQLSCTIAPNSSPQHPSWEQVPVTCPQPHSPIDGDWSGWSTWSKCELVSGQPCLCQHRQCNNPAPSNGGDNCQGSTIRVSNCTQNGGWTSWSAWSACSKTCGLAEKFRYRTCTNPVPAYGGVECVGKNQDMIFCSSNPPCPIQSRNQPSAPESEWLEWGHWSECSAPCGKGFQSRRRRCRSVNARGCIGCGEQTQTCNQQACPEIRKTSNWTPWLPSEVPNGGSSSFTEQRFRFTCHANISGLGALHISHFKREERFCERVGKCSDYVSTQLLNPDGHWSECSAECGGGIQYKEIPCSNSDCRDHAVVSRLCNTQPCPGGLYGHWSCWSEYSPCSVSCGLGGTRVRTRECVPRTGNCEGTSTQLSKCPNLPPCDLSNNILSSTMAATVSGLSPGLIALVALICFIGGVGTGVVVSWKYKAPHIRLRRLAARMDTKSNTYVSQHEWITQDPSQLPSKKEATIRRNSHPPIRANLDADSF